MSQSFPGPIVITGANGGLGSTLVADLLAAGVTNLACQYRSSSDKVAKILEAHGLRSEDHLFRAELTLEEDVQIMEAAIRDRLGVPWGLVNLAMLAALPVLLRPHVPLLARWPSAAWTVGSLAFFPVFFALLQGQDAILLLFLYALAFVSLKKQRLTAAGAWLGCAMFKFHLVLPFLLLLLVQQKTFQAKTRIVTGFLLVCAMLGAVSIVAVGPQQLIAYPRYVLGLEKTMAMGAIMPSDMPNLRGESGGTSRDRPRSLLTRGSRRIREQSACRPRTTRASSIAV